MNNRPSRLPFHYGWVIVVTGMLAVLGCIGLGRMALGMLLPSMGDDLALTYAQMGTISAGNFAGYLAAVLLSGWMVRRFGARTVIAAGLAAVAVSMMLVGCTSRYRAILALYVLTGIGSGAANMPVMGLVAHWFKARSRGKAGGILVAGNGFAIMLSGVLVPALNASFGAAGWRYGWLLLGAVAAATALACALLLRNNPEEMGLKPIGAETTPSRTGHPAVEEIPGEAPRFFLLHVGTLFFLFCFTYVIYVTFIVTSAVQEMGFSQSKAGSLWIWIGFCALFSGPLFGTVADRFGRRAAVAGVFAVQTCAYLLAAAGLPGIWLWISATLFGLAAFAIPSLVVAVLSDYLPAGKVTSVLGQVSFLASLGQIAGPSLAGTFADISGSFAGSYFMAGVLTAAACGVALLLPGRKEAAAPCLEEAMGDSSQRPLS